MLYICFACRQSLILFSQSTPTCVLLALLSCLQDQRHFMERICFCLSDHPRRVLLTVFLLLSPLFSYFILYPFNIESDIRRGFAQKDGRSTEEFKKFAEFYNFTFEGLEIWVVLISAKRDSGNARMNMSTELLNEIERLDHFVQNLTVVCKDETIRFKDTQGAQINYLFNWYKFAYYWSDYVADINLTFPVASAMGHKFFLGSHFFGVNKHKDTERGPIETMEHVTLWYMSQANNFMQKKRLEAIQMKLFQLSKEDQFSDILSFEMYGDQVANAEMLRGTLYTIKLFLIGVVMMVIFMLFMFQHLSAKSQLFMIIGAIGSPTLATFACFAIIGWASVPFNSIMCITPFLVLGIGVDDAFLLLHSWRRQMNLSWNQRMITVISEIGPSMAITSATNTLAFGVGILSPTPQMSTFCLCTAIAVLLDFAFEFLIFVPIMVIFYEEKEQKSPTIVKEKYNFSWERYTSYLLSPFGKTLVIGLTCTLYISAYVGVNKLIPTFDPSKTFPSDSDLLVSLRKFEKIQSEYSPLNFISRLPDITNSTELEDFFEMVGRLENRSSCYGPERTQLMLREYLEWEANLNRSLSYDDIPEFLNDRKIADKNIIQYRENNGTIVMTKINYIIICRGDLDWNRRAFEIDTTRKIIDEYPQFDISLFDYDSTIYDLIITVKHELVKAVLITFVCMTIACAFMIPSISGASVATLSMLSISFSLLGWLSIWGQDLDPVTMINVLMAIGFSVDFSAHICYHYHIGMKNSTLLNTMERIASILRAVGRPMVEASLSTLICMPPLFFVPVYIIVAFAKTVSLVALFGLLHGIVIIPVLLSFLNSKHNHHKLKAGDVLNNLETENMLKA